MNIIFEYEEKKLILPVNPDKVKVSKPSPSQRVDVVGIGEVSVPQTRKLASVSISSLFWEDVFEQGFLGKFGTFAKYIPNSLILQAQSGVIAGADKAKNFVAEKLLNSGNSAGFFAGAMLSGAGSVGGLIDDTQKFKVLSDYVKWFEDWQASGKPARWTIVVPPNEPPQCFDFNVTCENFTYEVRAGEEGDYYYELELLEWRDYGAKVLNPKEQSDGTTKFEAQPPARLSVKAKIAQEITATEKDSIWSTAKKYCKENWKDLYNETANKVTLCANPNDISGKVLKIPNKFISGAS